MIGLQHQECRPGVEVRLATIAEHDIGLELTQRGCEIDLRHHALAHDSHAGMRQLGPDPFNVVGVLLDVEDAKRLVHRDTPSKPAGEGV